MVWLLIFLIFSHIFLLSKLVFFPYPELFVYPYLTSKGLVPYTQIFDQHFPGLMFFPINLHTLGMTSIEAARYWQYGIIMVTHVLLFLVSKKLFKSSKKAIIANVLYLIWQPFFEGYVLWIDSFVPIFLLLAFLCIDFDKPSNKRMLLSGIFIGIAFVFKQVVFPLGLVLGVFYLYKFGIKKTLFYALGILLPTSLLVYYIQKIGAWNDFVFWTYKFNVTSFGQMGRKYPDLRGLLKSAVFYLPALLSGLYFSFKKNWNIVLLTLYLVLTFAFIYARFDYVHFQPSLVFACILIAYGVTKYKSRLLMSILIVCWLLVSSIIMLKFYKANIGTRVYFEGELETKLATEVRKYAKDNDPVFAMATTPHIYYLTNTLPAGKIFVFHFPWFMLEAEPEVLAGIKSDPPKVIIRDPNATTDNMVLVNYMKNIDNYVKDNYKKVNDIEGTEIYIPK